MGFAPKTLIKSRTMRGQGGNLLPWVFPHLPVDAGEFCKMREEAWHTGTCLEHQHPEAEVRGNHEFYASLGYMNKFEATLGYIARSCFKTSKINKLINIVRKTGSSRTAHKQI